VDGCQRLGCTREGPRAETYTVELEEEGGDSHTCDLSMDRWRAMERGATRPAEKRVMTGDLVCSSL
jgi:hypothetical protein